MTTLTEKILSGITAGVDRHWRYTKELINIKPEYLLTIAVADALAEGFDNLHGLDVQIKLEESTRSVAFTLLSEAIGLTKWFKAPKPKISRKGRLDIFVITEVSNHAIELKGFDPSVGELEKELIRIQELLAVNDSENKLKSGHVAFPSLRNREQWLKKHANTMIDLSKWKYEIACKEQITDEDPQDGIPCYFANCISVLRK